MVGDSVCTLWCWDGGGGNLYTARAPLDGGVCGDPLDHQGSFEVRQCICHTVE